MSGVKNWNSTSKKEIRKFGIIAFIFFGSLCCLGLFNRKPVPSILFGVLSMLGLGLTLMPYQLKPLYISWMKIAHLLGRFITGFFLAMAYYLVITPSALLKKIFGGSPLPTKPDKEIKSYWVTRSEPHQPKERFIKRY